MFKKQLIKATKDKVILKSPGSRAQLKQPLINKSFCTHMTEMKSNWSVISEAGDAVCGVV